MLFLNVDRPTKCAQEFPNKRLVLENHRPEDLEVNVRRQEPGRFREIKAESTFTSMQHNVH